MDYQTETVQVAVPLFEKQEEVLKRLPAALEFATINGAAVKVPVTKLGFGGLRPQGRGVV